MSNSKTKAQAKKTDLAQLARTVLDSAATERKAKKAKEAALLAVRNIAPLLEKQFVDNKLTINDLLTGQEIAVLVAVNNKPVLVDEKTGLDLIPSQADTLMQALPERFIKYTFDVAAIRDAQDAKEVKAALKKAKVTISETQRYDIKSA